MSKSLKELYRKTGSIVDYTVNVTASNVESVTLHILEDMIDVLLEIGYQSAEEAYQDIHKTSDLICWVMDTEDQPWKDEIPIESHREEIFNHLMFLADSNLTPSKLLINFKKDLLPMKKYIAIWINYERQGNYCPTVIFFQANSDEEALRQIFMKKIAEDWSGGASQYFEDAGITEKDLTLKFLRTYFDGIDIGGWPWLQSLYSDDELVYGNSPEEGSGIERWE